VDKSNIKDRSSHIHMCIHSLCSAVHILIIASFFVSVCTHLRVNYLPLSPTTRLKWTVSPVRPRTQKLKRYQGPLHPR